MKIEGGVHINYVSLSSNVVPKLKKEGNSKDILLLFYQLGISDSLGRYPNSSLKHFVK